MSDWIHRRPALRVLRGIADAAPQDGVLAHTAKDVLAAQKMGFLPETVFWCAPFDEGAGAALGRFFRASYEAAKRMTVTLPCAMPYLCFEGAISAMEENAKAHPETLEESLLALDIMTMQNETAFYAKLCLT